MIRHYSKMKSIFFWFVVSFAAFVLGFAQSTLLAAEQTEHEDAAILKAGKILPAELLSGPNHRVDERVRNDGFLNHYNVDSEFGRFEAISTLALKKLVHEINAIAVMVKFEESKTAAKALEQSGKKTIGSIKRLFTDPSGTLEGAATGLRSLFYRADEALFRSSPSQAEDSRVVQFIGFSNAKRDIAAKFDVDVYSSNKVLQSHLDRLGWADYLGGLSLGAALTVVPGAPGLILSTSGATRLLNDVINKTPPTELRRQNRQKLLDMGIDPDITQLFINNPLFSPREQTFMVASLEKMKGVANRDLFLKVALQVQHRNMAFLVTQMTMMFSGYHNIVAPIDRFYPLARIVCAQTKKGTVIVILPADYIIWSKRLAGAVIALNENTNIQKKKIAYELWTLGDVSKKAKKELKKAMWDFYTDVELKLKVRE